MATEDELDETQGGLADAASGDQRGNETAAELVVKQPLTRRDGAGIVSRVPFVQRWRGRLGAIAAEFGVAGLQPRRNLLAIAVSTPPVERLGAVVHGAGGVEAFGAMDVVDVAALTHRRPSQKDGDPPFGKKAREFASAQSPGFVSVADDGYDRDVARNGVSECSEKRCAA